MKKVVNVTIGQTVFVIEEDAYVKLDEYLNSVRRHFKEKDEVESEIIEDIEISFAEKFLAKRKNKDAAITLVQVEESIKAMGSVTEMEEEDTGGGEKNKKEGNSGVKVGSKFYRDSDDVILGGVASGVAAYFGVDVMIVRILFVASMFVGGLGFFVYIALWIFAPKAKSTSQKYEMRGERLTLDKIETSLKKGREKLKKKDLKGIRGVIDKLMRGLGALVMGALHFLRWIIGLVFAVVGIGGIGALSFGLAMIFSGSGIWLLGIPIDFPFESFGPLRFYLFWFVTYVVAFVPLLFVLLLGMGMLKRKNFFTISSVTLFIILWFVALGVMTGLMLDFLPWL